MIPVARKVWQPAAAGWDRRRRGPRFGMKPLILSTATVTVSADRLPAGSAGSGYLEIEELVENSRIHSIY